MIKETLRRAFGSKKRRRRVRSSHRRHFEMLEGRRVLATISGQVIDDLNGDAMIDPGEPGQSAVEVYLDANDNGQLDRTGTIVEPDAFADNQPINATGITFSLAHEDNQIDTTQVIVTRADALASTGQHVFGTPDAAFFHDAHRLRIDFDNPVSAVAIDFIGSREFAGEVGALEIYDSSGVLLDSFSTVELKESEYQTMRLERAEADISYATAFLQLEFGGLDGRLDNLRINDAGSEVWTITNAEGQYSLQRLDAGTHQVRQVVPDAYNQTLPTEGGAHTITVADGDVVTDVEFANVADVGNSWQNRDNPLDVNNDGAVVALDALLIINEMNQPKYSQPATGALPPPPDPIPAFYDVNGDGFVVALDAILVINHLNNTEAQAAAVPRLGNSSTQLGSASIGAAIDEGESEEKASLLRSDAPANHSDAQPGSFEVDLEMLVVDKIFKS